MNCTYLTRSLPRVSQSVYNTNLNAKTILASMFSPQEKLTGWMDDLVGASQQIMAPSIALPT